MLGLVMMTTMIFLRPGSSKPDVVGVAMAPVNLLDVERLAIDFGGVKAVDGVSFVIDKPQVFSIIGPNGAGKTTLFNTCPASIGRTTDGCGCAARTSRRWRRIGWLPAACHARSRICRISRA